MLVDKTVKVTKEADELVEGLVKFVADVKKALDDGWQPAQDIPLFLQAAIQDLVPAVQGADKLALESKENEEAFTRSFVLGGHQMIYVFKK